MPRSITPLSGSIARRDATRAGGTTRRNAACASDIVRLLLRRYRAASHARAFYQPDAGHMLTSMRKPGIHAVTTPSNMPR